MKLAACLFAVVALDALTFAAVASLPGVLAYEQNPVTRTLAVTLGVGGFVALKLGAGAVAALLLVGARRWRVVGAVAVGLILVGAASNVWALHELAG